MEYTRLEVGRPACSVGVARPPHLLMAGASSSIFAARRRVMIPGKETLLSRRYRLGRRLGAGAMGAVYEAEDLITGRRRAVKVMHAHTLDREDLRSRFELEAKISGRIPSPFVVDVIDAGVDEDGTPYIAMELLHGEDLSRRLARVGRFSAEEALSYLVQVASALDETHRAGVVHRDLKPANLFLEERSPDAARVKVLDFGVAKVVVESAGHATGVAGTPTYMAPEQFRGSKIGPRADIYALGMIAFAFVVGSAYWEEEREAVSDAIAFALVAVRGPPEPATRRAARRGVSLPVAFDVWFERATAVDPQDRFPTARAAVLALAEVLAVPITLPELDRPAEPGRDSGGTVEAGGHSPSSSQAITSVTAGHAALQPGADAPELRAPTLTAPIERTAPVPVLESDSTAAAPVRRRWPARSLAVVGTLAALTAAVGGFLSRGSPPAAAATSPLDAPDSVLACPVFDASGVDEPSGWLGAAAAATFCERARVVLGGASARTLAPAELLMSPVQPSDRLPQDPYASPDVRGRSLEAARRRGAAYAEGRVIKESAGFRVEITLRRADGTELGRGGGSGRALYEAIRAAMDPLIRPGVLPKAARLDPTIAEYTRAPDIDGGLALLDLSLAMVQNAGSLPEECARVEARSAEYAELGPGERYRCAYTLGLAAPRTDLPPSNPSSPGAIAARARVRLMVEREHDAGTAAEIARLLSRETSGWGRSVLAATGSCLAQASDPQKAWELALLAVQAEPKNPLGEWCEPWIQIAMVTRGTASAEGTLRALRAWAPWEGYGWLLEATTPGDRPLGLEYARRAYVLSPLDAYVADTFASRLLASGDRENARAVAVAIAQGGHPVHAVESDLLLLGVEASEARFGSALSRARRAMVVSPADAGWVRLQRLEIGWRALQIGRIVGSAEEIADLLVERFIDPSPSPLDGAHIDGPLRIAAICARASTRVAKRCFSRFRALRDALALGALPDTDAFTEGAERYAAGDLGGAAKAWRPLVREPGPYVALLDDAMIAAFEWTGETDLVVRLEAAVTGTGNEWNGASLAVVRAARRAAKKGDRERARALAKQVIEAWSVADEPVPAVEEMRRLVARLE